MVRSKTSWSSARVSVPRKHLQPRAYPLAVETRRGRQRNPNSPVVRLFPGGGVIILGARDALKLARLLRSGDLTQV